MTEGQAATPNLLAIDQALGTQRDEDDGEWREVVAEPVAELDPALAEVHEVGRGDRRRCQQRAGDPPVAEHAERRQGQQVGGAG